MVNLVAKAKWLNLCLFTVCSLYLGPWNLWMWADCFRRRALRKSEGRKPLLWKCHKSPLVAPWTEIMQRWSLWGISESLAKTPLLIDLPSCNVLTKDSTTAVAGEADIELTCVSLNCHVSGRIYVTLVESTQCDGTVKWQVQHTVSVSVYVVLVCTTWLYFKDTPPFKSPMKDFLATPWLR